jgi:SAM-dependent methyltransferase
VNDQYYFDPQVASSYDSQPYLPQDDVPFYVELAHEAGARDESVLELGCGTGRVTLPIAATGVSIVGLDYAAPMLDEARRKAGATANPRWLQGDMRDFHIDERFGLVIIPFRSFLLLLTVEDQLACLTCVHEHLVSDGRLALNFFNPDLALIARGIARREGLHRATNVRDTAGRVVRRWQKTEYDAEQQGIDWTWRHDSLSDEGAVIARVEKRLRLRYVFREQMEQLLTLTGFEVEALCGWFDRRPFEEDSSEMVWQARKA